MAVVAQEGDDKKDRQKTDGQLLWFGGGGSFRLAPALSTDRARKGRVAITGQNSTEFNFFARVPRQYTGLLVFRSF